MIHYFVQFARLLPFLILLAACISSTRTAQPGSMAETSSTPLPTAPTPAHATPVSSVTRVAVVRPLLLPIIQNASPTVSAPTPASLPTHVIGDSLSPSELDVILETLALPLNASFPLTVSASITAGSTVDLAGIEDASSHAGSLPPIIVPVRPGVQAVLSTPIPARPSIIVPRQSPPLAADGIERTAQVPILMYHYLSVPPADADIYRLDLSVTPDLFAAHLDRLRAEGYQTVSLYDLMAYLTDGTPLPPKPVILTFDDGYRDNYENAFPILKERGMTATFFIVTDFIDEGREAYVTWEMVRAMYEGGMSIESHGRNHLSLKGRAQDFLVFQALGTAETIAYHLGTRPRFVSYPAGEYDQNTIDIFRSAGYLAGMTTIQGATHNSTDLFELRRVRIRGTTTPDELARLLVLDW